MATGPLTWDEIGERLYETGTDRGVLFNTDSKGVYTEGVAWNGLTAVSQTPDGAEATDLYADNSKYLSLTSAENFKGTIEAYTYPEQFAACDGSAEVVAGAYLGQQPRETFGLSYRTLVGNDTQGNRYGQKLHIIYGAKASPSERSYETVNADPNAVTLSWEFTTTPVNVDGFEPTAYVCLDSSKVAPEIFKAVSDKIWGSSTAASSLPTLRELVELIKTTSTTTTTTKP